MQGLAFELPRFRRESRATLGVTRNHVLGAATRLSACIILPSAPVAQLDRAIASGAIGREFESLRARQNSPPQAVLSQRIEIIVSGCGPGRFRYNVRRFAGPGFDWLEVKHAELEE